MPAGAEAEIRAAFNRVLPLQALGGEAAAVARRWYPRVPVTWEVARGPAGGLLAEASRYAQLAVVGPRGLGEYSRLPLGSVSQHLLRHGHCPVAVIREPSDCG